MIYVDEVSASQVRLKGLLVSDERNAEQSRIIVAREGRLLSDEATRRITLRFLDGSISESDASDRRRFRQTYFSLYDMTLPVDSPLAAVAREEKPEKQLPLRELIAEAESHAAERPDLRALLRRAAQALRAARWPRSSSPSMGFPLGIRAQRGGRAVALALSFGIVVAYYILYSTMEGLALRGAHARGHRGLDPQRHPRGDRAWPSCAGASRACPPPGSICSGGSGRRSASGDRVAWSSRSRSAARRRLGRLAGPRASTFIMDRYLIRQYLIFLGIGTGVGAVLIAVVDLLQTLDRFLRSKPPFITILEHFLYRMPGELYKGLPMIVLIATVFLFLSLTRQRELDALKAAGVSLYRASLPILLVAGAISVLAVVFQEAALPDINAKADEVDRVKIRGAAPAAPAAPDPDLVPLLRHALLPHGAPRSGRQVHGGAHRARDQPRLPARGAAGRPHRAVDAGGLAAHRRRPPPDRPRRTGSPRSRSPPGWCRCRRTSTTSSRCRTRPTP